MEKLSDKVAQFAANQARETKKDTQMHYRLVLTVIEILYNMQNKISKIELCVCVCLI